MVELVGETRDKTWQTGPGGRQPETLVAAKPNDGWIEVADTVGLRAARISAILLAKACRMCNHHHSSPRTIKQRTGGLGALPPAGRMCAFRASLTASAPR